MEKEFRDKLVHSITQHKLLGIDWIDVDGWKVTLDDNNKLYCLGVSENLFTVYDINISTYNKLYLIKVDFNLLPFDGYKIPNNLRNEIDKLYRHKSNCVILEIDNAKELNFDNNLCYLFRYLNVNIIYLRDTESLNGWFSSTDFHMFLAPNLKVYNDVVHFESNFSDKDEDLVYYLPKLNESEYNIYNLHQSSKYRLITQYNNHSVIDKLSVFGRVSELVIDKIDSESLNRIKSINGSNVNISIYSLENQKDIYLSKVREMEGICEVLNSLK